MLNLEQLARHEAAHAVAGFLLDHPVGGLHIDEGDGWAQLPTGHSQVASYRNPTPEQAIGDIAILLAPQFVDGTGAPDGIAEDDAQVEALAQAFDAPVDLLAKSRRCIQELVGRPDFQLLFDALSIVLLRRRHMSPREVNAVLERGGAA